MASTERIVTTERVATTERIVIPRCIGCGAMREFERCEGGCREQYLELVAAADLDALEAVERSLRARIELALPVLLKMAAGTYKDMCMSRTPRQDSPTRRQDSGSRWQDSLNRWQDAYLAVAGAARQALREAAVAPRPLDPAEAEGALQIGVWRCRDCGAVDAPQECLGICIWRRFEWVTVADYEASRARAAAAGELERQVFGWLRRVAFATPRADAWERSWRALSQEAEILIARCAPSGEPSGVHV